MLLYLSALALLSIVSADTEDSDETECYIAEYPDCDYDYVSGSGTVYRLKECDDGALTVKTYSDSDCTEDESVNATSIACEECENWGVVVYTSYTSSGCTEGDETGSPSTIRWNTDSDWGCHPDTDTDSEGSSGQFCRDDGKTIIFGGYANDDCTGFSIEIPYETECVENDDGTSTMATVDCVGPNGAQRISVVAILFSMLLMQLFQ